MATCAPIRMEVLAGARDEPHLELLRRLLSRTTTLPMATTDYDSAALLYRTCRRAGATVRSLVDCLIASVAIRTGVHVLTIDSDFEALAFRGGVRLHVVT